MSDETAEKLPTLNVIAYPVDGAEFECPTCKEQRVSFTPGFREALDAGVGVVINCPCGQEMVVKAETVTPNKGMNRRQRRMMARKGKR